MYLRAVQLIVDVLMSRLTLQIRQKESSLSPISLESGTSRTLSTFLCRKKYQSSNVGTLISVINQLAGEASSSYLIKWLCIF